MKARVLGLALLWATAVVHTARAQDAASSAHDNAYPRTAATTARPSETPRPEVPTVFQRQATFYIPFSVNQNPAVPVDVVLFASADNGISWNEYARQNASQKQFMFRAAKDGEYCFASRMVATASPSPPTTGLAPELRIIVDTTVPRLTLDATVETSGTIRVKWDAYDDYLLPEKLLLQYQTNPGQPWKPLDIERPVGDEVRRSVRGETRCQPERGSAIVTVRLEARDSADNVNELTRRLIMPLSIASPFGARTTPEVATEIPADPFAQYGMPPTDPSQQATALPASPAVEARDAAPADERTGVAWPSRNTHSDPWTSGGGSYGARSSPVGPPVAQQASSGGQRHSTPGIAESGDAATARDTAQRPLTGEAATAGDNDLPAGERPRMTRAKRFNLDYSIDAVGPAGVDKVELWLTRNGGRDWDLWGVDEDRESPLLVEVESEGIYGFRVVIVGKNGLASQTPRPGDLADLWVGVDTTDPVARIVSAAYGEDQYAGHLDIRWTAVDAGFGARPVTLMFSDRAEGPWTTIASGLPNTGQYYWRVDSRVPEQFFLKMEVRDEAGNTCVDQLDEPIRSAGLTPRGRIRGIQPVAD